MRWTLTLVMLTAMLAGCGGGLELTLVEAAYRRPSNVGVYFTVDTNGGDPVAGLQASDFRIYEDGDLVSIDESRQTIINPEVAAEHYTLLLVDMSGSVTESDQVPLLVEAASQFTSTVEGYQKVAVYAFDGAEDIHPIQPFTASAGGAQRSVQRLDSFQARDPSTNLNGALIQGVEELNRALDASTVPLRFGTIVVFTDGTDRAHRVSYDDMMDSLDEAGYDVFAIGVGNEIDEGTLSRVGYSGYVLVQDSAAISQAFDAISQKIVGYTQRFYLLSYCSPARAGTHEVTIEALSGDASGSLTYTFDATDFGPECNPDSPPPFDTSGRGRAVRRTRREPGGRISVSAGASVRASGSASAGAGGGDPEGGDY